MEEMSACHHSKKERARCLMYYTTNRPSLHMKNDKTCRLCAFSLTMRLVLLAQVVQIGDAIKNDGTFCPKSINSGYESIS